MRYLCANLTYRGSIIVRERAARSAPTIRKREAAWMDRQRGVRAYSACREDSCHVLAASGSSELSLALTIARPATHAARANIRATWVWRKGRPTRETIPRAVNSETIAR